MSGVAWFLLGAWCVMVAVTVYALRGWLRALGKWGEAQELLGAALDREADYLLQLARHDRV